MLLANSEGSGIGANCGEGGGVGRSYVVIVGRGRREGETGCFGREAISAHDIGFRGVVTVVVGGIIGDVIGSIGVIAGPIEVGGGGELGVGGVGGVIAVGFSGFVCFSRTWS